jgi:transposase/plasmid stabilization system protein ParE
MGHRQGENRHQAALFPLMLDELVGPDDLVRVIDAWISSLDLKALGFSKAQTQIMGRPPYDPADLLKLYIWGYLNAVRSSRALERQTHSNVKCMWLLGRLQPDHKTIAEFRRANVHALVAVCASFVQFARAQQLIASNTIAIDGSKIRAVASRKTIIRADDLTKLAQHNAQEIERYLQVLDTQDSAQDAQPQTKTHDVQRALRQLRERQAAIQAGVEQLATNRSNSLVQTEPQAKLMKSLHGPGYNLQTAVEAASHLIVAHEVVNDVSDRSQLHPMAQTANRVLQTICTVVADAGYSNGEHLAKLQDQGVVCFVAPNRNINNQGDGTLYDKSAFSYDHKTDTLQCPVGKTLKRKTGKRQDKMIIYAADHWDCQVCASKSKCTGAKQRFVSRHEYEQALQDNAIRLAAKPQMMRLRRSTVEHPFGTIKTQILGNARLLMRGLEGARAELSLAVLAYNLKRVFNMKGGAWMLQATGA